MEVSVRHALLHARRWVAALLKWRPINGAALTGSGSFAPSQAMLPIDIFTSKNSIL